MCRGISEQRVNYCCTVWLVLGAHDEIPEWQVRGQGLPLPLSGGSTASVSWHAHILGQAWISKRGSTRIGAGQGARLCNHSYAHVKMEMLYIVISLYVTLAEIVVSISSTSYTQSLLKALT